MMQQFLQNRYMTIRIQNNDIHIEKTAKLRSQSCVEIACATCHIDNRRSFCIGDWQGGLESCRVVGSHMGHAISSPRCAGHCLLFVAHVQLARNADSRVTSRIF